MSREPKPDFDRVLTALNLREPDRVPLGDFHVDALVKEAFLGRKPTGPEDQIEFWRRAGFDYVTASAGILWDQRLQVAHATREGARYGAAVPVGQTFSSGTWATNVRDVVVGRSASELVAGDVCVALVQGVTPTVYANSSDYSTNGTSACFDDSADGDNSLRVQVSGETSGTLETGLWSRDYDIEETATSKHEESAG